jgi:hypothetical protein
MPDIIRITYPKISKIRPQGHISGKGTHYFPDSLVIQISSISKMTSKQAYLKELKSLVDIGTFFCVVISPVLF